MRRPVGVARHEFKEGALEGLERWKTRHPDIVEFLEPADILVDGMRGRSALWYRVRVNLIHVPEDKRPVQEPLESDFDPWAGMDVEAWKAATAGSRARRPTAKSKTLDPPTNPTEEPAKQAKVAQPKAPKP